MIYYAAKLIGAMMLVATASRPLGDHEWRFVMPTPRLTTEEKAARYMDRAVKRFWRKVSKTEDGCWEWTAALDTNGYGSFGFKRRLIGAHRMSWILANGEIQDGLCVLHRCDNQKCVRPEHLFLGTVDDNNKDRQAKGRSATGARHGSRTQPQCLLLRARGDANGSRKYPERLKRGDSHYSRTNPELLARGERNGKYTKPQCTPRGEKHGGAKLCDEDVRQIRTARRSGQSFKSIARHYRVDPATIRNIWLGRVWKHVEDRKEDG